MTTGAPSLAHVVLPPGDVQSSGPGEQSAMRVRETSDIAVWSDLMSPSMVRVTASATRAAQFTGRLRSRSVGDVFLGEVAAQGHRLDRSSADVARDAADYVKLSLQLDGDALLIQDGREALLRPGDFAVYDTARPYTVVYGGASHSLTVMFPKRHIDIPVHLVGELTAVRLAGDEGLSSMVAPFLTHLTSNLERLGGAGGLRLIHNTLDMVATVLHSELDARVHDRRSSHRAALVQSVRAYIDDHLDDPDLHPGQIAAGTFISTRYLHDIFRDQGVTVGGWIRNRRLELCRRELADPMNADKPVSVIAARWGFVDASHFCRLFKSKFGASPSSFRGTATAVSLPTE